MGSRFRGKLENTGRTDLELDVRILETRQLVGIRVSNTANIYRALGGATVIGNANQAIATYNLGRDIDALFAVETNMLISF